MRFARTCTVGTRWCLSALLALSMLLAGLAGSTCFAEDEAPVLMPKRVETIGTEASESVAKTSGALISIELIERPLKQVLDYLSTVSGKNIRVKKEKDNKLLVTLKLENVTYRAILDFIARKYGMTIDDSMLAQNIIFIDTPEKVSMVFQNADIRDVINTIAIQANANVVVDSEVTGNVTMRLENVPWKDALQIVVRTLDKVLVDEPNNVIRITTPQKISTQLDIRLFRLAYISPEGSRYTAVLQSDFTKREEGKGQGGASAAIGESLIDVLLKMKSTQGQISFEKRSNTIVVRDTATTLDQMQQVINKLDVPPKQIHVAVKLVQLTDTDAEALGIDWGAGIQFQVTPVQSWLSAFPFDVSKGLSQAPLIGDTAALFGSRRTINMGSVTPTVVSSPDIFTARTALNSAGGSFGGVGLSTPVSLGSMGFQNMQATLQMIRNKTHARVIQAPQIVALDNEEATIQVGQLVRYAETVVATTEGGGQIGGFREAQGSPLKLGFQVLVIAHVTGPENNILMTIVPKTENFSGFQTFGSGANTLQLPQTNQSIVVTKMMLRNGETGVIGGMRDESEKFAERRLPVFGDIPFIGRLFKNHTKDVSSTNLLVFVTPTIIDFFDPGTFGKDLERARVDYTKAFTNLGEEESGDATQK
jgi:type IV pilus assembly protein PilQ